LLGGVNIALARASEEVRGFGLYHQSAWLG